METAQKVLVRILKDFTIKHTVTSLSKAIRLSRVGTWKILIKLESDKLIMLKQIGTGKTSTYVVELNWNNILTEKNLELLLIQEAQNNQRWIDNFKELEKDADLLILFGSILYSPKEANDIDLLIVANNLSNVSETILKIQKSQMKKIHTMNLTEKEFKKEISKHNKIFIDAINKGVTLFGQERFINIIKELKK